jgi:hypothetical protein
MGGGAAFKELAGMIGHKGLGAPLSLKKREIKSAILLFSQPPFPASP